jgi:hypothetical protein
MAKIQTFTCDICHGLTPRIFEFQPRLIKKVAVGDKVQSIDVENSTIYEICSEECAIKVLRKVGKMLFHPEPIKVRKNGKNGKVELKE